MQLAVIVTEWLLAWSILGSWWPRSGMHPGFAWRNPSRVRPIYVEGICGCVKVLGISFECTSTLVHCTVAIYHTFTASTVSTEDSASLLWGAELCAKYLPFHVHGSDPPPPQHHRLMGVRPIGGGLYNHWWIVWKVFPWTAIYRWHS